MTHVSVIVPEAVLGLARGFLESLNTLRVDAPCYSALWDFLASERDSV